ncbi:MAG: glutamyl-tRNA reductase [Salinarimonadaceae bacterium]|nr:MAG: glutamyl-tRNA reductase [Salinarimonadaceae bacterium]
MGSMLMLFADILVAVLLVATVVTCVRLSRRITRLQTDEASMRKTIVELVVATDNAERAIAGLRATLGECEKTLADRLRTAERYAADLAEQVEAGENVMSRMMTIVDSSQAAKRAGSAPAPAPEPAPAPAPAHREQSALEPAHFRLMSDRISDAAELLAQRAMRRVGGREGGA